IHQRLMDWRLDSWKEEWRGLYPSYGPRDFISDSALLDVAQNIHNIQSVEDLDDHITVSQWSVVAPGL
ncbi:hypothetical protein FB45DRAFT_698080, partial [Roridomyces roridus]